MSGASAAFSLRPLILEDMPALLAVQCEVYPAFLWEDEQSLASRLTRADTYCMAALREEKLVAYLIAHGWASRAPPSLDMALEGGVPSEVLLIHDLAVSSRGRGLGIGRCLIEYAFERAIGDGLRRAELVAVDGAADYWRRLGFSQNAASRDLIDKAATYGAGACWMTRELMPQGDAMVEVR